jgi:hypothetical protein
MTNPFASPSFASFEPSGGKLARDEANCQVLVDHRGWIRFCGIVSIIFGVFMIIGIWTIVVAWIPVWMGIALINAASMLAPEASSETKSEALRKLALYFKLTGIFCIIYLGLVALVICAYIVMAFVMLSQR